MTDTADFPIICLGASAGGIEALEGFFRGLPPHPGLALVIVTHLSPDRESLLHEIVSGYTDLPVQVAADAMTVEVDNIYVMPADSILGIENRRLTLRKNTTHRERKPIDIFMSALAVDRLLGLREIVVRRLVDPLIQAPGLAGATELGDGRAILIIDATSLARYARAGRWTSRLEQVHGD